MSAVHVLYDADAPHAGGAPRLVTDGVMGGISRGRLFDDTVDGRRCLRLAGSVSLANNGGFVQAAVDVLPGGRVFDASPYAGLRLVVRGNGEDYNLHLRTADLERPWQSYRCRFAALPEWQALSLPFAGFEAHRTEHPLDLARLRRVGLVAIGREFEADLCVARIALVPGSGFAPGARSG